MKRIGNFKIYGDVEDIGHIPGIGFMPQHEYYLDVHTYFFGIKLKTVRYWSREDYLKKKPSKIEKPKRSIIGFKK